MKHRTDPERLLDDLLEESLPPGFGAGLLEQTLRRVRQRKRARRISQSLLMTTLLVAFPLALWKRSSPPVATVTPRPQTFGLVRSQPLPPSIIVGTGRGSFNIVTSPAGTVIPVETQRGRDLFREINDDELLALAGGRPVILVRQDSAHAEFLILDSADQKGFAVP